MSGSMILGRHGDLSLKPIGKFIALIKLPIQKGGGGWYAISSPAELCSLNVAKVVLLPIPSPAERATLAAYLGSSSVPIDIEML